MMPQLSLWQRQSKSGFYVFLGQIFCLTGKVGEVEKSAFP